MVKAIPSFKYLDYCPVENLKNWMFENRDNLIFPISDKNVALIIKKYALKAGLDEKNTQVIALDQDLPLRLQNMVQVKEI